MTNPTTAEPISAPPQKAFFRTPASAAVLTVAAVGEMQAVWEDVIDQEIVFDADVHVGHRHTYKKLLLDQSSMRSLQMIWKESPYVTEDELALVGLAKAFEPFAPINAHALAYELSEHKAHLDRNRMAVRNLAKAAAACGLIERRQVCGRNAIELRGTAKLDALMKLYAERVTEIFANVATLLPEVM